MSWDWQTWIALAAVVAAAAYVGRRSWQSIARRKSAACGGCGTCSASTAPTELVDLKVLAPRGSSGAGLNGDSSAKTLTAGDTNR
jgi:hypothetical protein